MPLMSRTELTSRFAVVVAVVALTGAFTVVAQTTRADAAGPSVLLVQSVGPEYAANVIAGLNATGQVGTVTDFDAASSTPTESDFAGIDVAFVVSDDNWADSAALGDVLADFVDAVAESSSRPSRSTARRTASASRADG